MTCHCDACSGFPTDERDLNEADDEWEGKALARAEEADD